MALPILFNAKRLARPGGLRLVSRSMATVAKELYQHDIGATMPPGHKAKVGSLETFQLPDRVTGSKSDKAMGQALVKAWKRDGIFQIAMSSSQSKAGRGIGSHTDYGLLVIAAQDDVGGLFIRPPYEGESYANWEKSAAGMREEDEGWVYVPPVPGVFTVFPGDMMQYMTNSFLPSTPHKVGLNTRERFAFAYFHEPNFQAVAKPLPGYNAGQNPEEGIHYGTHFTNMFLRNYPDRITTQRLLAEDRYKLLSEPELHAMPQIDMKTSVGESARPASLTM
ncbi:hypothetical protein N0V82_010283 [Gnomoniopsis sp. IMI 355080]|nr:hypothetical protein N0V82_010283 [Gnomoniopsis sp. IMI 355080]